MAVMKEAVRNALKQLIRHVPWGVREALFDGYVERLGGFPALATRVNRELNILEIGADGDRGMMTSASNDDTVLMEYALTGTFAPTVMQTVLAFFGDRAGTYIDIGANIGLTTIPVARKAGIHCLAFEPEPVNFGHLTRNVARNAADASVELHQMAIFDSRGALTMALADDNVGDHRLTHGGVEGRRTIQVPTVPLDDFFDRISGPLAMKVDTQGAEPFVVKGGAKTLAKAGLLAIEFCPFLMRQLGGDPSTVIDVVTTFDRLAIMAGGVAEAPLYIGPADARERLEHKARTAAATDGDYLDILAQRDRPE